MKTRQLSQNRSTVERRERRFWAQVDREHAEFQAEVMRLVKEKAMDFDDAWVAAGGERPIYIGHLLGG